MKRKFFLCAVFFAFLFFLGSGFAEFKKTKIAVVDFTVQGEKNDSDLGRIASDWLITTFVQEGRFDVVERNLLNKIIEEQSFSKTGMVASDSVVELGKILGVQVMITGSVVKFQNYLELNTRIIDVKDASIIVAESVKGSNVQELKTLVLNMAKKIINDFPLRGYVVNAGDQGITIDLGRTSGVKEGMLFSIFKEGKVIKHPKTGEVLDIENIETGIIKILSVREKISVGEVTKNSEGLPIEYGHKVKSIAVKKQVSQPVDFPVTEVVDTNPVSFEPANTVDPYFLQLISDLKSGDNATKVRAAKIIYRRRVYDDSILDAVKDELLNSLGSSSGERYYVDALAYCCKIIYASKRPEYRDVLYTVSNQSQIRKVKNYATKYYNAR